MKLSGAEGRSRVPPPPQRITEHLNGHIIGHHVMKKTISVALYNHYCNLSFAGHCAASEEDDGIDEEFPTFLKDRNMEPENFSVIEDTPLIPQDKKEFLSPVVARVVIEASSHRVHLRKSNTLTFDSTGPSRPVHLVSSYSAQYLDVPYVRIDCSNLIPVQHSQTQQSSSQSESQQQPSRQSSSCGGLLNQLMSGYVGESVNSVISKLYKKADFDLKKAQRGIVFLDGMDKIGMAGCPLSADRRIRESVSHQVFKEILQIVEGTKIDVSRLKSEAGEPETSSAADKATSSNATNQSLEETQELLSQEEELFDTSNLFFVCFGVTEDFIFSRQNTTKHPQIQSAASGIAQSSTTQNNNNSSQSSTNSANKNNPVLNNSGPDHRSDSSDDSGCVRSPATNKQFSKGEEKSGKKPQQQQQQQHRNLVEEILSEEGGEDEYSEDEDQDDEYDDFEDYLSSVEEEERELTKLLAEATTKPLHNCQSLWGMKNVDLKFTPEALEIIATQALAQKAGSEGVTTILEKLFVNIKFDILGTKISRVEITEEAVLGKERPNYFYSSGQPVTEVYHAHILQRSKSLGPTHLSKSLASFHSHNLSQASQTTDALPPIAEEQNYFYRPRSHTLGSLGPVASSLTDFDMRIIEEIEL